MKAILVLDERLARFVSCKTEEFVKSRAGKIFLNLMLIGPFTFLPTVWQAWTASDIEVLRTPTWPMMIVINMSTYVALSHNGDWRTRTVMILWIIVLSLVWIATIVR